MHPIKAFFAVLICFPITSMTAQPPEPEIVYEIFVQSFRDSNGDGIGDLQGVISRLDYIKELGATTIWLTPIHPSPSYHKYDVTDYYGIHPDFGTMADFDQLIQEVHKRDMKFILDFVVNHTSALHPWFVAAAASPSSPSRDYYVWKDENVVKNEIEKKAATFDSDNLTQWHAVDESKARYYGFFWKGMPDLNFDNTDVRKEIYKAGKFWIENGIDGFRLDAARHIYPDDRLDDTRAFWEEFTMTMRAEKADILIVGEVWSDAKTLSTLFAGLPSLFNFELTRLIPAMILSGSSKAFVDAYVEMQKTYRTAGLPFDDAILLNNHDMNRIRSGLNDHIPMSKLAASVLLTLPGTAYLYYGEEIGMLGRKPDEHIREPFLWGDNNFEKSWIVSQFSTGNKVDDLEKQMNDPGSMYHHYKTWIALRKENPSLAFGQPHFIDDAPANILAFTVEDHAGKQILVLHNLADQATEYTINKEATCLYPVQRIKVQSVTLPHR